MYFKFISDLFFLNFSGGIKSEENIPGSESEIPEQERGIDSGNLNVNDEKSQGSDQGINSENEEIK